MKVEQACRFRTGSGFKDVGAASPGFNGEIATKFAGVFNDIMMPIIGQTSDRVLTCIPVDGDVFYALSTKRSEGRGYVFTHGYALKSDDYSKLIDECPEELFCISPDDMYRKRPTEEVMPVVELVKPEDKSLDAEEILKKYGLTTVRFARILEGAVLAASTGNSFTLYTEKPQKVAESIATELFYAVLKYLPEIYRTKLSLSTGMDTRMSMCIVSNAKRTGYSSSFILEKPSPSEDTVWEGRLFSREFIALAGLNAEELNGRKKGINEILSILLADKRIVPSDKELAIALILEFIKTNPITELQKEYITALLSDSAGSQRYNPATVDGLLIWIIKEDYEKGAIPGSRLSRLIKYDLNFGSKEFHSAFIHVLSKASGEDAVQAIKEILSIENTQKKQDIINVLISRIPDEWWTHGECTELAVKLVGWAAADDEISCDMVSRVADIASESGASISLLYSILDAASERLGSNAHELLFPIIGVLSGNHITIEDKYSYIIDKWVDLIKDDDDLLTANWINYISNVTLDSSKDLKARLELLIRYKEQTPRLFSRLEKCSAGGTALWSEYNAIAHLQNGRLPYEELAGVCAQYNGPDKQDPDSNFEQIAFKIWEDNFNAFGGFNGNIAQKLSGMQKRLVELDRLSLSIKTKSKMAIKAIHRFWEDTNVYEVLVEAGRIKSFRYSEELDLWHPEQGEGKYHWQLWKSMIDLSGPEYDSSCLDKIINENPDRLAQNDNELQEALVEIVMRQIESHNIIMWDPILYYCAESKGRGDKRIQFDAEYIEDIINEIETKYRTDKLSKCIQPESCFRLRNNEKAMKALEKAAKHQKGHFLLKQFNKGINPVSALFGSKREKKHKDEKKRDNTSMNRDAFSDTSNTSNGDQDQSFWQYLDSEENDS